MNQFQRDTVEYWTESANTEIPEGAPWLTDEQIEILFSRVDQVYGTFSWLTIHGMDMAPFWNAHHRYVMGRDLTTENKDDILAEFRRIAESFRR